MLHDVRASERAAGRFEWLSATAASPNAPWLTRSSLKLLVLVIALLVPLLVGGLAAGTSVGTLALAFLLAALHMIFWWGVCLLIDRFGWSSLINLMAGLGVWMMLAVIVPAAIRAGVDAAVHLPDGGDIILTQREAVNDAWDLPKEATMEPFLQRHPEWADHATVSRPFEWKWYYAFQQVGDQTAEPLSQAYREGRARRDALAGALALLSPPALIERGFQRLAGTDARAALAYEGRVRAFHAALRAWHYPKLFREEPFSTDALADLPSFQGTGPAYWSMVQD
ncbi:DUF3526 domain-containing protein [bacterium]|nr:DUF3526 domain-containing protein [bacterium]